MSIKKLSLKKFEWLDIVNPSRSEIDEIITRYDFHELDKEALIEEDQRDRVDTYPSYIFITLHFPKYDQRTRRYITSEFNIFISKKFLIQFRYHQTTAISKVFEGYEAGRYDEDVNTGYVLYDVIDSMLDKLFKIIDRFTADMRAMEDNIFRQSGKNLIYEIMIRKRNVIALKHIVQPQLNVLKVLELRMNALFGDEEVELYFENLQDKIEKIYSEILLIEENVESMEDTMKSIFDMQTNNTIKYLTFFSAFMLPLTLITSFFGMNVEDVPFSDVLVYSSLTVTTLGMAIAMGILRYFRKI